LTSGLPRHEEIRLLAAATGRTIAEVRSGVNLTAAERHAVDLLARRRVAGEPLQYLEGTVDFAGLELVVDSRVLIPRPETEYLTELLARTAPPPRLIVDLCTGSGALALTLKKQFPESKVVGTDISPEALAVAALNSDRNRLEVEWRLGDLFDALPPEFSGRIDLLVANPPYVSEADWAGLPVDVRHEPRHALVAGPDGLEKIEVILNGLDEWLAAGGSAWIEVGDSQSERLADGAVQVVPDQYDRPRYLRYERSRSD
jgi:release factor glutamine methyltransferase